MKIAKLSAPLIAANLAQMGMQIVDALMLGQLGQEALAVGALGGTIVYNILVFCIGILSSVGVLIAQSYGAKEDQEISYTTKCGLLLAVILSFPCLIIIWIIPDMLLWFKLDHGLLKLTSMFLYALAWGMPSVLIFTVLRDFTAALGHPKIVMMLSIAAIPTNALLNYMLMYGKLGFPILGVVGAGYATSLIRWGMLIMLILYIYKHKALYSYIYLNNKAIIYFSRIKKIVLLGYPTGLMMGLEIGMFSITTMMMGYFGVTALAAHHIAIQCANFVFTIPLGIAQATSIQVSHAIGANRSHQVHHILYMAVGLGTVASLIIALVFIFLSIPIIYLFLDVYNTQNEYIKLLAINYLWMAALLQFLDSVQVIVIGALRGIQDAFMPMILSVLAYWIVGISTGYIFAYTFNRQGIGLWYGLCLGIGVSAILLGIRFNKLKNKQKLSMD